MKSQQQQTTAVPVVQPAPTREQVVASNAKTAKEKAGTTIKAVEESKKKAADQQGVYNNIKTSMAGDYWYGRRTEATAKFGRGRKDTSGKMLAKFGEVA